MSWLLYGLGGGLGHFQRSLSLARAAAKLGVSSTILANSAWLSQLPAQSLEDYVPREVALVRLPVDITPTDARTAVERVLGQVAWDALVVDTFPRGLGGELAPLLDQFDGKKIWTHRDIAPPYLEAFQIRRDWAPKYDLVMAPGERGELADLAQPTAPWLLLSADELNARDAARRRWNVDDRPLVVVVGSGRSREADWFGQLAVRLQEQRVDMDVRFVGLNDSGSWPLLAHLSAVDVLVCAGGYNTIHEARALNVPAIGIPQPRKYDRQSRRIRQFADRLLEASECTVPRLTANIVDLLSHSSEARRESIGCANGADEAAQWCLQC